MGSLTASLPPGWEAKLGFLFGSQECYAQAEQMFRDLMSRGQNGSAIRHNLGLAQYLNGQNEDTIRTLEDGRNSSLGSESLNLLGQAYVKSGQPHLYFEKATVLDPDGDLPQAALELVQIEQSKLPEAIRGLRGRLKTEGHSALLWYFLGVALNREGAVAGTPEGNEAEQSFRKAIQLNPKLPFPYLELAKIYARTHRAQAAIPLLRQAMTFLALHRSAAYQLAVVYRQTNQGQLAQEMLREIRNSEQQNRASAKFQPDAGAKTSR